MSAQPPDAQAGQGTQRAGRWQLREGLILGAYLLLTAAGVVTVLLPELHDEPDADRQGAKSGHDDTPDAG